MTTALVNPIPFPRDLPAGYRYLDETVVYDPDRHLALEPPEQTLTLRDLGYCEQAIASCPTDLAVTSPARLLSDEGVAALQQTARALRRFAVGCERVPKMVRGGVYQSRFLRDLCLCPRVAAFLSEIYRAPVAPHTMPSHLGHLNFAPDDVGQAVDKWHHDTLGLDYVLMVSDPNNLVGGRFQYFLGTKDEAAALAAAGREIPGDRTVSPVFPGPGYMLVLHGNMVVHRAAKLDAVGERITMVNGYVPLDVSLADPCRFDDLKRVDPHHVLFAEWARHKAWLAQGKLGRLIDEMPFVDDRTALIGALRAAIADVEAAVEDLGDESEGRLRHYGG